MSEEVESKQQTKSLFFLIFPTILVALIPDTINQAIWLSIALKVLLVFFQFALIKSFTDKIYG